MERKIFFCKNCGSTFSGNADIASNCPNCKTPLVETDIIKTAWDGYSKEEKDELREALKKKYSNNISANDAKDQILHGSSSDNLLNNMSKDVKQIAHDIHFMATVLMIYLIISGIIGIIIIAQMFS